MGAGPLGFEPRAFSLEAPMEMGVADWNRFRDSLEAKKYRGSYASTVFNYAQRFSDCLFKRDLSKIRELSQSRSSQVLKALSHLAKFLGCYEDYKGLIKNYGLHWVGRSTDDLIIDRLTRTDDPEEVWRWIRDVKEARPELCEFMDLMAVTGLRFIEAFNSFNLIATLTKEKKLTEKYYDVKTGFLEHFRFKETFIRSSKKAFISYVPIELLEAIGAQDPIPSQYSISRRIEKRHLPIRFSDIRELYGTFAAKWLRPEEVDFISGRTSSVYLKHYYNPKWVTDLRQR